MPIGGSGRDFTVFSLWIVRSRARGALRWRPPHGRRPSRMVTSGESGCDRTPDEVIATGRASVPLWVDGFRTHGRGRTGHRARRSASGVRRVARRLQEGGPASPGALSAAVGLPLPGSARRATACSAMHVSAEMGTGDAVHALSSLRSRSRAQSKSGGPGGPCVMITTGLMLPVTDSGTQDFFPDCRRSGIPTAASATAPTAPGTGSPGGAPGRSGRRARRSRPIANTASASPHRRA